MSEMPEQLTYFKQYAEGKLQDHIDAIESQYKRREVNPILKGIAYMRRQRIFEKELSKKIDQLAPSEFDYIRLSLWSMKHFFMKRLSLV